jgi:MHS family proline/betaine transporter-like MFS transporter
MTGAHEHIGRSAGGVASGTAAGTPVASERNAWRAVTAAGLGTAIELYDFQLYAVLAVVFSPLFFAEGNPTSALLGTLAIFAVGFFVRPLGGIVFGRFGDKHGRAATLAITVIGIGMASAGIGLLPTHAMVGIAAAFLLLALRLAQGFFAGGELAGASTYIAECSPAARRGFFGAFNPAFATLGLTFATAAPSSSSPRYSASAAS